MFKKKIILIVFFMLFLAGCSTSSISLTSDRLILKKSDISYLIENSVVDNKFLNYKDLFVNQYSLKDKNNQILFYENVKTALDYELNFGDLYTVMYVFDVDEYEEVYVSNNFSFFQLKLKNKSYINIAVFSDDSQEISYVYGFSNREFLNVIKKLKSDEDKEPINLKYDGIVFDINSKSLTKWNDILIYFIPLITPVRYQAMF